VKMQIVVVGMTMFNDLRNVMKELKKMNLTEQERFVGASKI